MKNKTIFFYGILVSFVCSFWYIFLYTPKYTGAINPAGTYVFSHRGLGNFAPDNSLSGSVKAIKDGFYGIDVDAQLTKDGQIVIFHDLSIDRLTTGSGKVGSKTLNELIQFDLAQKYQPISNINWTGSYVASFEEFLQKITPGGILMAELKVPGIADSGIEKAAIDIIAKYNAWDRVYLSSFNPFVLYRLKQIDSRVRTVMISMDTNWNPELLAEIAINDRVDLPWILRQEWIRRGIRKIIQPDGLSINHETDENTINALIEKGYPVFLWTIDTKERLKWASQKSPYGIISDDPYLTRDTINQK